MKVLEIILLLVSTTCFLVYEKIPKNIYAIQVRNELKQIIALHGLENSEFLEYEYEKDSITYSLSDIKSKAVFPNVNMLKEHANEGSFFLEWEAKEGETNYISPYHSIYRGYISKKSNSLKTTLYEIEFEVEVSKFQFEKYWEYKSEDDFYTPSGIVNNTFVSFKVKNLDESPFSEELLLEVINGFLAERNNFMNDKLNENGVEAYYSALTFEGLVQKVYTQTSTNIPNENNVDLTFESEPEFTSDSLVFKRKGKLNDLDVSGDETLSDSTSFQKFYINKKLIQNLISNNLFAIVYEQTNNPSTKYELTVEYLKQIIGNNISYSDDTALKVYADISKVEFDTGSYIGGVATLKIDIISKSDLETVFTFELEMAFKFTPTILNNGLNFVLLSKDLNVNKITGENIIDEELLEAWIENTYLVALGNCEYNLFALSFDLSYYFTTNKLSYEFDGDYLSIIKQ